MLVDFLVKKNNLKKFGPFCSIKKISTKKCSDKKKWTKNFRPIFLFDDFQKNSTIFFSMAAIFRPKSAKMSTQGNAPNFFLLKSTAIPCRSWLVRTVSRSPQIFVRIRETTVNFGKKLSHPCILGWNEHTYCRLVVAVRANLQTHVGVRTEVR